METQQSKIVELNLTLEEAQLIMGALGKFPLEQVFGVFNTVGRAVEIGRIKLMKEAQEAEKAEKEIEVATSAKSSKKSK